VKNIHYKMWGDPRDDSLTSIRRSARYWVREGVRDDVVRLPVPVDHVQTAVSQFVTAPGQLATRR
jgi:hypothetical protein